MNKPVGGWVPGGGLRTRLSLRSEFLLALVPTLVALIVLAFVNALSRQQILFASLASSAFLIYLDPRHAANRIRTLIIAQLLAASIGLVADKLFGSSVWAGGLAMVLTITLMILLNAVHPPAVGTSLIFAFRAGSESDLVIFLLAVIVTVILVILQRTLLFMLGRNEMGVKEQP